MNGSAACLECSRGTYSMSTGATAMTSCNPCPASSYSEPGSINVTDCKCNKGYTGANGAECRACLAGTYKVINGSGGCVQCAEGMYSMEVGATSLKTCLACPAGTYSWQAGSSSCLFCSPGTYSNATGQSSPETCVSCPNNSISLKGSESLEDCTCIKGYWLSEEGGCSPCLPGAFKNFLGSASCALCPAGKYTAEIGATSELVCDDCPDDTISEAGSSNLNNCVCAPGYAGSNSSSCVACPAGSFKDLAGFSDCTDCDAGKYQERLASTNCTLCQAGKYSVTRTATNETRCQMCPQNQPASLPGSSHFSNCTGHCQAGSFGSPQNCTLCPEGTFRTTYDAMKGVSDSCSRICPLYSSSERGSVQVTDCKCNSGFHGPDGGECVVCQAGKYKAAIGAKQCVQCEAGKYSDTVGATAQSTCDRCVAGKYSGTSGAFDISTCEACDEGTYSQTLGATSLETCEACEAGKFSSTVGAASEATCQMCGAGKYSMVTGASSVETCLQCGGGKYFAGQGATSELDCVECGAGTYSAMIGATDVSVCQQCEAGKYSEAAGASTEEECLQCVDGTYADQEGSSSCTSCSLGSTSKADGTGCECDVGHTSLEGKCVACEAGTYKDVKGPGMCVPCEANYTSIPGSSMPTDCLALCAPGQTGQAGDCRACNEGKYKETVGSGPCSQCPDHSSSPIGSSTLLSCACVSGYTGDKGGSCLACAQGKFKEGSGAGPCKLCPVGTYKGETGQPAFECEGNAKCLCSSCSACPSGSSTSEVGSADLSDCICVAGRTGPNGGVCTACNPGTYKGDIGSSPCTACPPGKTSPAGSTAQEACENTRGEFPNDAEAVVRLVVGFAISKEEFDETKQLSFRQGMADIAGVSISMVRIANIVSISQRRKLLAGSIEVQVEIAVPDSSRASGIANSLTETALNDNFSALGLPEVQVLEQPSVQQVSPSSTPTTSAEVESDHTVIIISTSCAVAIILLGACLIIYHRRQRNLRKQEQEGAPEGQLPSGPSLMTNASDRRLGSVSMDVDGEGTEASVPNLDTPCIPDRTAPAHASDLPEQSPAQVRQSIAERIRTLRETGDLQISADLGLIESRPIEARDIPLQMVDVSNATLSGGSSLSLDQSSLIDQFEARSPRPSPAALRRFDPNTNYRELLRQQMNSALPEDDEYDDE